MYTQEFQELAGELGTWPKDILIDCFKDGLNNNVYHTCISPRAHKLYNTGMCW